MANTALNAEIRTLDFTKGELNSFRRNGKIPAILFGKGMESLPLFVNLMEFKKAKADQGKIFEISAENKTYLVNAKTIHTNAVGNIVTHIDFLNLDRNQETTVRVKVVLVGESPGAKAGGVIQVIEEVIAITGVPKDIPESIEIDISELELGVNIAAGEIKIPKGTKLEVEDDKTIVTCSAPKTQEEAEPVAAAEGEAAEATPAVEGEATPEAKAETTEEKK